MKTQFSIISALIAGFIATAAMTAFTYMAPLMGLEMNIPKMLASTMGAPIVVGWLAHFMIGEVLAVGYSALYLTITNKNSDARTGAIFGIIPWLIAQLIVMPMMTTMTGGGFLSGIFSGSFMMAVASLAGHLIYGAVLGIIYKPQIVSSSVNV
jgi:uncharacterized membrane protein YagU involved in acid resistance